MNDKEQLHVHTTGFDFVLRDRTDENLVRRRPKKMMSRQESHTLNRTPDLYTH